MRLAGLIALALAAAPAAAAAQAVQMSLAPGEVLLRVEAQGEHYARPDTMTISAGVVTTGATSREATGANAELANRLIEALRGQGVAPGDIRTTRLRVEPQFEEREERRGAIRPRGRILGYLAQNGLSVRVRDLKRASAIVDALFAAGANDVDGPDFAHSDPLPARRAARRAAVAAALEEANTYAEALNMRVARVLRVSERGDFDEDEGGNYVTVTGSRVQATPIEPGELRTEITVWIDYALVPR